MLASSLVLHAAATVQRASRCAGSDSLLPVVLLQLRMCQGFLSWRQAVFIITYVFFYRYIYLFIYFCICLFIVCLYVDLFIIIMYYFFSSMVCCPCRRMWQEESSKAASTSGREDGPGEPRYDGECCCSQMPLLACTAASAGLAGVTALLLPCSAPLVVVCNDTHLPRVAGPSNSCN